MDNEHCYGLVPRLLAGGQAHAAHGFQRAGQGLAPVFAARHTVVKVASAPRQGRAHVEGLRSGVGRHLEVARTQLSDAGVHLRGQAVGTRQRRRGQARAVEPRHRNDGGRGCDLGLPSIREALGLEKPFGSQPEARAHRIERT